MLAGTKDSNEGNVTGTPKRTAGDKSERATAGKQDKNDKNDAKGRVTRAHVKNNTQA